MSPWVDLSCSLPAFSKNILNDAILNEDLIEMGQIAIGKDLALSNPSLLKSKQFSPLYGSFTGLPPLLIQYSTSEVLSDDSELLAKKAKAEGLDVTLHGTPYQIHVFQLFYEILVEETAQSLSDMTKFWERIFD